MTVRLKEKDNIIELNAHQQDDGNFIISKEIASKLGGFVRSIENQEAAIKQLREECNELYKEADRAGFKKNILKELLSRRKKSEQELDLFDTRLAVMERALRQFGLGEDSSDLL